MTGVEGPGSHGAELVRFLLLAGGVSKLNRPNRQHRRIPDKGDPSGAKAAVSAV